MTRVDHMGWAGMKIGKFVLDEQLGSGAFSYVYSATDPVNGRRRVIKFARTVEPEFETKHDTKALMSATGSMMEVKPDVVALLQAQFEKLRWHPDSALPSVDEFTEQHGYYLYRMELIEGPTLGELLNRSLQPDLQQILDLFIRLCAALEELENRGTFLYHGDLKPQNVIIQNGGIRIIDPGYFGRLKTEYGEVDELRVTTPAYYPLFSPDDQLAVGLMLWEAVLRRHPLCQERSTEAMDRSQFTDELYNRVRKRELIGQHHASPLINVEGPCDIDSRVSPRLENFMLKALHLKFLSDGKRDYDDGFENFAEMRKELEAIRA